MATAFILGIPKTETFAPSDLKPDLKKVLKGLPDKQAFFADELWKKNKNSQWSMKIGEKNFAYLQKTYKLKEAPKKVIKQSINGYTIKWMLSSKKSATQADAKTTRMQELGSAWIMRRAINDNIKYKSWEDIRRDKKYHELVEIYPAVDDNVDWLQGYYAQQKKMLEEFGSSKFSEYNRDGGFMDYISQLVRVKFGISKKDTWNPADIWLIQDEKKQIGIIKKDVEGNKRSQTIQELNTILRKMYKDRKVVGISLKKISGKIARYEEFNISKTDLNKEYNYDFIRALIDLTYNATASKFGTQDLNVIIGGHNSEYKFQIKGNDSAGMSNLKFEPTAKGATAARVGKAPVDMVNELMRDNKIKFVNNHNLYPKTVQEFDKEKDKYIRMFMTLRNKADTRINDASDFEANIKSGLTSSKSNHIAVSKLMQLHFLHELMKLTKKNRNEFMTDMVFIAAKKGARFGPFGKLY